MNLAITKMNTVWVSSQTTIHTCMYQHKISSPTILVYNFYTFSLSTTYLIIFKPTTEQQEETSRLPSFRLDTFCFLFRLGGITWLGWNTFNWYCDWSIILNMNLHHFTKCSILNFFRLVSAFHGFKEL